MLRLLEVGNSLPLSLPLDQTATFQAGRVAQLTVSGNNVVCGVSDGSAPLGIIDDTRTSAFTANSVDEVVIVDVAGVIGPNGVLVAPTKIKTELLHANVVPSSFISNPVDVELIPANGVIAFPAGTPLNIDQDGDGYYDGIRTVVSYTYQVAGIPGDDTTAGSQKITVWFQRMLAETDQFETQEPYPVNAPLFVSESGLLTTREPRPGAPMVAMVFGPPNSIHGTLMFLWF